MAKGRKTGGRLPGSVNKTTAEIKALAQVHAEKAIAMLGEMVTTAETDQAKIAAAKELLDRGYGKPTQAHAGDPEGPAIQHEHKHGLSWMTEAQAKARGWG